jgi:hypothetical protein
VKPISEPSQGRDNAYLGWTDNQLLRRPPIPAAASASQWASAALSPTNGGSTGDFIFLDVDIMITNAPTIFGLNTGANGSLGVEILVDDIELRMWSGLDCDINFSPLTGPNIQGLMWNDFFSYYARLSHEADRFTNLTGAFHGASTDPVCSLYTMIDLERVGGSGPVSSSPQNVIEFGFAQNSGHNGDLNGGAMFEVLTTDLSTITFLPSGT